MPDFDTSVPHIARVYDYWLGGKDNFAADRAIGERAIQAYPNLVFSARSNRAFLARTVRFLAAEQMAEMIRCLNQSGAEPMTIRDRAGVARLFGGLELVEPGLTRAAGWRPDSGLEAASPAACWGGVARKP